MLSFCDLAYKQSLGVRGGTLSAEMDGSRDHKDIP